MAEEEGRFTDGATLTRTDSLGRVLTLRQLNLREEMAVIAAAGEFAEIRPYMFRATLVACVRSIDGVPTPKIKGYPGLEAMFDKVGAPGVAAVAVVLAAERPDLAEDAEDAADDAEPKPDPAVAVAKN